MAQVDKIKIDSTTYDIAASGNSTNVFTSADATTGNSKAWTEVAILTTGESTKSIFNKVSTMFKNIRFLKNVLGGDVTPSNTVSAQLAGKAPLVHSHTTGQLPVSTVQTNSNAKIPTSALVYSMNQTLTSLNDAFNGLKTWNGGEY